MIDGDAAGPEGLEGTEDLKGLADRSPATRASDRERDAVVQRVQEAFAEGRLDDTEFDERMRAALTARTHADLDVLLANSRVDPKRVAYVGHDFGAMYGMVMTGVDQRVSVAAWAAQAFSTTSPSCWTT